MNRKSIVLVFSLLLIVLLLVLTRALFLQSLNAGNLVKRHLKSVRAFWAAEAAAAEAINNVRDCVDSGICVLSGNITYSSESYAYSSTISPLGGLYYRINCSATVDDLTKSLSSVVTLTDVDPNDFDDAVKSQGTIDVTGSAEVNPSGSIEENATLVFSDFFSLSKEQMEAYADYHYTDPPNNVAPCEGITWIELTAGGSFRVTNSAWTGSGILIIEGDLVMEGTTAFTGGQFDGIIYVIGEVDIPAGNPTISGSILIEGDPAATTSIKGNATINHNSTLIDDALDNVRYGVTSPVAWWEN